MSHADRPLKRITININASDYEWLIGYYGEYQVQIRHIIAMFVIEKKRSLEGIEDEYD